MPEPATDNTNLNSMIVSGMRSNAALASDIEARGKKAEADYDTAIETAKKEKPEAPKIQDLPQAPKVDYGRPMDVFKNWGVLLMLVGSLATRQPLVAAAKAAAGAMNGYRQGKLDQAKQASEDYKNALDAAVKQNEIELERYKTSLESAEYDEKLALSKLQADAAASKDEVLAATVTSGNIGHAIQLVRDRERAGRVLKSSRKAQEKQEETQKLYGSALGQIDRAIQMAQDPGVIGTRGLIGRTVESVLGQTVGDKVEPSRAFQNQLENVKAATRNLITKSHYMSPGAVTQLDKLVPGESMWDTQTSTITGLQTMRAIIQSEQGSANSAIADEAEKEAAQDDTEDQPSDNGGWSITPVQ